jgi:hypothetical protein
LDHLYPKHLYEADCLPNTTSSGSVFFSLISAVTSSDGPRPNSEGWVITEDDFISVYCVSLPWIGTSILMAPKSDLSDGLLYLVKILRKSYNME